MKARRTIWNMKPKATRSMAQLVRVLDRMFIVLLKEMYLEIRWRNGHPDLKEWVLV